MNIFNLATPDSRPVDIIAWAEANIRVNGHSFDAGRTPQLVEPIRAMADADTRIGTLIKPVQVGGSTAGEVVLAYWAAFYNGLIQFNWENDQKAANRWADRILPALESCRDIKRTGHRFEELICEARYVNTTVRCQGVFNENALDSDTVPLQINEEIHSWKPGFLSKARRRQTQVWNSKAFDISNASYVGDQLHAAYEDGTAEVWEVNCPGCGGWHDMHFRWDKNKPELGGLRWESDACKLPDGRLNYNKLAETIRYQFPCGHEIRDVAAERRLLRGRYRVTNDGAHISHRSWIFDAVSCAEISWLKLVQEWHAAYCAQHGKRQTGSPEKDSERFASDPEPLRLFVTERECRFYSEILIPYRGAVVVNSKLVKNREGLAGRRARLWAADKQKGRASRGELSHYWLVIRDVMFNGDSQLIFEGKVHTDADLIAVLDEHGCHRRCGVVDATGPWVSTVREFCYRNGLGAVIGVADQNWFTHPDKVKRFYSPSEPIHTKLGLGVPPRFNYNTSPHGWVPHPEEPLQWQYNKAGLLSNLLSWRNSPGVVWEVPGDVSEDYKIHNESWELRKGVRGRSKEQIEEWRQTRADDHMFMCECYIAMLMNIGGFMASRMAASELPVDK